MASEDDNEETFQGKCKLTIVKQFQVLLAVQNIACPVCRCVWANHTKSDFS